MILAWDAWNFWVGKFKLHKWKSIIVIFGFWVALVFEVENCDSYFNQKEGFDNCIGDSKPSLDY